MVASAAIPGLILCFTSMLLLIVVSVSAPVVNSISFLDVNINGRSIHFGEYGYTGSKRNIGYSINETALGLSDKLLDVPTIPNLSRALVLHTVAACILFAALVQGTCAAANYSRVHTLVMGLTMSLALVLIVIAFAIDIILFNLIGERIRADGYSAHLSSATWLTLSALIITALAICASVLGSFGDYDDDWDYDYYPRFYSRRSRRSDYRY